MKKNTLLALIFALTLGLFLYVAFGIVFILFLPPFFFYLFNNCKN